jgi:hypothetical protein
VAERREILAFAVNYLLPMRGHIVRDETVGILWVDPLLPVGACVVQPAGNECLSVLFQLVPAVKGPIGQGVSALSGPDPITLNLALFILRAANFVHQESHSSSAWSNVNS